MMTADEKCEYVKSQLRRLQDALADLEQTVKPKNAQRFELMAESYRHEIGKLKAELAAIEPVVAVSDGNP